MKIILIKIIFLFSLIFSFADATSNGNFGHELNIELENSYFCAVCEPVDAGVLVEPLIKKYPTLNFFRLKPVNVYWGSLAQANESLMIHSASKRETKRNYLVVLRSKRNLGPGDWYKRYTPIQTDSQCASYYLLDGNGKVDEKKLHNILECHSTRMRIIYPLDKAPDKVNCTRPTNGIGRANP